MKHQLWLIMLFITGSICESTISLENSYTGKYADEAKNASLQINKNQWNFDFTCATASIENLEFPLKTTSYTGTYTQLFGIIPKDFEINSVPAVFNIKPKDEILIVEIQIDNRDYIEVFEFKKNEAYLVKRCP